MAAPTKEIKNVLVGRANLYVGTLAEVTGAMPELPPDTVAFDTDWAETDPDWYHPGYSDTGLDFGIDRKEKRHYVDDISVPAVITVEETTLKVGFVFAEATLENLQIASGGGEVAVTAAGAGQIGMKELVLSEDLDVVALGFEGKNAQGYFRRVVIPRVVSIGKIKAQLDRAKNKQVYAAEFESVCAISDIKIWEKTANATA